ncbi:MAG: C4-dicarboxylate ABC transporter [Bacteroidota bacterium]
MITRILRYFEALMVLAYVGFGIFVLFYSNDFFRLSTVQRIVLGVVLIVYGLYRVFRVYKKYSYKEQNENEEEN